MLLRLSLSSSLPFVSCRSTKPPSPFLYPVPHHSITRPEEVTKECLTIVYGTVSKVHSYGTTDFENKQNLHWRMLYRRVLKARSEGKTIASAIETWDQLESRLSKWELSRVARELRKFRYTKAALEVYEWMAEQGDRYTIGSSDVAIQLDLIGTVQGPIAAEEYFSSLSNSFKTKRTYCALLNVYTQYKLKEKAQATFDFMRENGYLTDSLVFNVMMTLYQNVEEHAAVMNLIQEMKERNIKLDTYSYNIWIGTAAAMQDLDQMVGVLQVMQSDNVNPTWSIYGTLANMYMKFGLLDKAEACLREAEQRITGRDRKAFMFIITVYGNMGKREDMYRIWKWYKSLFTTPLNTGYRTMLTALLKLDDVAGAESIYEEWTTSGGTLDPRICQVLMGWYCRNGLSDKARETLDQFVQLGGRLNQYLWVTLAEGCSKENRLDEALSYFDKAISCVVGAKDGRWKPNPSLVEDLLKLSKQREQSESLNEVVAILKRGGLAEIEPYQGLIQQFSLVVSD